MKSEVKYRIGVLWSLLSAFLWSTTFIAGKSLMREHQIDPFSLSLIRFSIGSMILFGSGCIFFRDKIFAVTIKDLLKLSALAIVGVAGMSVFLFMGQKQTTAINSSIIIATAPVATLFISTVMGEKLTKHRITGIFICLLGCALAINVITRDGFQYHAGSMRGDVLVFLAALCWAVYSVFSVPVVKRLGGFTATMWAMLAGGIILFFIQLLTVPHPQLPDSGKGWLLVLYIAVFPTALAFLAWYDAMEKIELPLLNVMQYLTPIFTIILAMLLLGEKITLLNIAGICLVFVGIAFTVQKSATLLYLLKKHLYFTKIRIKNCR